MLRLPKLFARDRLAPLVPLGAVVGAVLEAVNVYQSTESFQVSQCVKELKKLQNVTFEPPPGFINRDKDVEDLGRAVNWDLSPIMGLICNPSGTGKSTLVTLLAVARNQKNPDGSPKLKGVKPGPVLRCTMKSTAEESKIELENTLNSVLPKPWFSFMPDHRNNKLPDKIRISKMAMKQLAAEGTPVLFTLEDFSSLVTGALANSNSINANSSFIRDCYDFTGVCKVLALCSSATTDHLLYKVNRHVAIRSTPLYAPPVRDEKALSTYLSTISTIKYGKALDPTDNQRLVSAFGGCFAMYEALLDKASSREEAMVEFAKVRESHQTSLRSLLLASRATLSQDELKSTIEAYDALEAVAKGPAKMPTQALYDRARRLLVQQKDDSAVFLGVAKEGFALALPLTAELLSAEKLLIDKRRKLLLP